MFIAAFLATLGMLAAIAVAPILFAIVAWTIIVALPALLIGGTAGYVWLIRNTPPSASVENDRSPKDKSQKVEPVSEIIVPGFKIRCDRFGAASAEEKPASWR